jgi:hypothetical protein
VALLVSPEIPHRHPHQTLDPVDSRRDTLLRRVRRRPSWPLTLSRMEYFFFIFSNIPAPSLPSRLLGPRPSPTGLASVGVRKGREGEEPPEAPWRYQDSTIPARRQAPFHVLFRLQPPSRSRSVQMVQTMRKPGKSPTRQQICGAPGGQHLLAFSGASR